MDDAPAGPFRPISPNPFIVGNPVRDSAMFFGREAEFELARKRFKDAEAGHLLVFCGERRSGKTSILYQIAQGRLGPEYIPVLVDMQSMAIETEADFLVKVSKEILSALPPEESEKIRWEFTAGLPEASRLSLNARFTRPGENPAATFHEFVELVMRRNPDRKLALCFDEYELFENKIEAGTLTQDSLNILAGLMDRHAVFVIFTGSQHIEDRKAECWRLLPKGIYRRISYLSRPDALNLMTRPVAGKLGHDPEALEHMLRLTAGQPFYTQALCQALVDHLNDLETTRVTVAHVDEVVKHIVENPFPQMIFLWDGLEREEKLVMSLLAEALGDENAYVTARELVRSVGKGGYPLRLTEPTVATTLENLFKDELLLKNGDLPAGYAFRMDLWRQWVRRMHSVWQVVREEKIAVPARAGGARILGLPWPAAVGAMAVVAAGAIWLWGASMKQETSAARPGPGLGLPPVPPDGAGGSPRPPGSGGPPGPGAAMVILLTQPEAAEVVYRGEASPAPWPRPLNADERHEITVRAPGYRDSVLVPDLEAGREYRWTVALAPLTARVRVESDAPGVWVEVDGARVGTAPVDLALTVPAAHLIRAGRPGARPLEQRYAALELDPGSARTWRVDLEPATAWLAVRSSPAGAEVIVDGEERGATPAQLDDVTVGSHRFQLRLEGYVPIDTVIAVAENTGTLPFVLQELPPGVLIILGDEIAQSIQVDDRFIGAGVQNSGRKSYGPGMHSIQVVLQRTGEVIRDSVRVVPDRVVRYDYSRRQATVEPEGERP